MDEFLSLIANEDKKNPYSDEELAGMLNTTRQQILKLRKKHDIPNYSERRRSLLIKEIGRILINTPDISNRKLTQVLEERGFKLSSFLAATIRKEIKVNELDVLTEEVSKDNISNQHEKIFSHIIGAQGSISSKIRQAVAAVLYPPNGLHTIIIGQTGTGKTQLAEAMYKLALSMGRVLKDSFIRFNCADYYNNPQLLISQLFGHVKGAFTGAESNKEGLIKKADNGIILLDEIHRLPMEGQEILFSIIDKGVYRRLGETDTEHKVNTMIIGATTEDIDSHLSLTFRRRIPMIIELPPLNYRPIDERYEMIVNFFKMESDRIHLKIKIQSEVICALLLYDCSGNIGQLKSDIQVACARAYLKYLNQESSYVLVEISDFNTYVYQGLSRKIYSTVEIEKYIGRGVTITPGYYQVDCFDENDAYILPNQIYRFIEERHKVLKKEGNPQELAYKIISRELDIKLQNVMNYFETSEIKLNKIDITKIVGQQMVDTVETILEIAQVNLGNFSESLFYCLALHLYDAVERIKQNKLIVNPGLERIKKDYHREYCVARAMLEKAEKLLSVKFPDDEVGFVALYLRKRSNIEEKTNGLIGIIVITHGYVGTEMAKVANSLLGHDIVRSISIELDESNESAIKRTSQLCRMINNGSGILILVDMGSPLTFGEIITKETGIPTRTVSKVHTALVLDAAFKVLNKEMTLDELYQSLDNQSIYLGYNNQKYRKKEDKAIITLCITGVGAALEIKKLIEDTFPEIKKREIEIIPLSMMQASDAIMEIIRLQEEKDIIAIVGTVNPNINGIKYVSIESIMNSDGLREFQKLIYTQSGIFPVKYGEVELRSYLGDIFNEKLILPHASFKTKDEVLDALGNLLLKYGYVRESFLLGIYKREKMSPSIFANGIAIPHTYPIHVLKPGIAIATLVQPIKWAEDYYADKILMFALHDNSSLIFRYLYKIGNNKELLDRLVKCPDEKSVISTLLLQDKSDIKP
ncbi:MAG: sigma 54-interacting transcriptional regulator, partial [Tepidanaerobacteraceae bacterium]